MIAPLADPPNAAPMPAARRRCARGASAHHADAQGRWHRFQREPHGRWSFVDSTGRRRLYLNAALPLDADGRLRRSPDQMVCPDCGHAHARGGRCDDCRVERLDELARRLGLPLPTQPPLHARAVLGVQGVRRLGRVV